MLKPIEKPSRRPLIHHPSNALDAFCHYDASNSHWLEFDESVSCQLIELEYSKRQYISTRGEGRRISEPSSSDRS